MKKVIYLFVALILIFSLCITPCFAATSSLNLKGNEWTIEVGTYGGLNSSGNPFYVPERISSDFYLLGLSYKLPPLDSFADYTITYSFWQVCTSSSNAEINITIQFYDSSGKVLDTLYLLSRSNCTSNVIINNQTVGFNVPSGTVSASLFCSSSSSTSNSVFCYNINITGNNMSAQIAEGFAAQQKQIDVLSADVQAGFEKTQQEIEQGFSDINNAGSQEPPLDTDISAFQSVIDTMNGWIEQLNGFADSIDTAGESAHEYISRGTEVFNSFLSIAPTAVTVLIAFGIVFIVVRKIIGR